jgi:RNA polymerase sigma-70 factor (ECF subfamily)
MFTTPASLLERLRQPGEREAWARFVELYTPLFFAWARRLGLSLHDAADLVQDLFVVLVNQLPQFHYEPSKSFRAWLKTILVNRWRNWQRRHQRCAPAEQGLLEDLPARDDLPELEEAEHRRHVLGRMLALLQGELEPATWQAFRAYVLDDRAARDVAAELGISVNAVYLARSRVLRRLREELAGLLD